MGGWSTPRPGLFIPWKETWFPLYRRLGGSQGQSEQVQKISPPTGIRSPGRPARNESDNAVYIIINIAVIIFVLQGCRHIQNTSLFSITNFIITVSNCLQIAESSFCIIMLLEALSISVSCSVNTPT
jgi:hypothetical protein